MEPVSASICCVWVGVFQHGYYGAGDYYLITRESNAGGAIEVISSLSLSWTRSTKYRIKSRWLVAVVLLRTVLIAL